MSRSARAFVAALVAAVLGVGLAPTASGVAADVDRASGAAVVLSVAVAAGRGGSAGVASGRLLPAAVAADFRPGNIISDQVFFDPGTMTVAQVQAFLDVRGASCRPNSAQGNLPCLKDYRTTTVAKAADAMCRGYVGGRLESAAEIIVGVAHSCGVNPRVLLVLLEKEQSLVTRATPTTYAYERATGFGCPDTAPCNAEYFGLFNQLYLAARQYQRYALEPDRYPRYRPGRENSILYHPNAACGASMVYIENQATAGLYTYTPYQPNAAALANLYGTGDSCSSYGNRNFWRLFTDWFGSTQGGGFLLRSPEDATVYLVSGSVKYPIPSLDLLSAYAPLGPLGFVSKVFLDRYTTGPLLSRFARDTAGTVYFVENGTKHAFGSCAQVEAFGGSCGSLVQLAADQAAVLTTADPMRTTVRTPSGRIFHVTGGTRREAVDDAALVAAGVSTASVTLADATLASLPYGTPLLRNGIVVRDRGTGATYATSSAGVHPVPAGLLDGTALGSLPARTLDSQSVARVETGAALGPFVRTPGGRAHLLRGTSATPVDHAAALPAQVPVMGEDLLAVFSVTAPVAGPLFVQVAGSSQRHQVVAGVLRPVHGDDELALLGGSPAAVVTITPAVAALLPVGPDAAATQFSDVRLTHPFASDILWLAESGVTSGYEDGTFRPTASVSRQAMAAFLHRLAGEPAFTPPARATFADVPVGSQFFNAVEWLAAEGIATGTPQGDGTVLYAPTSPVSRQAMAAFLHRLVAPSAVPSGPPAFRDVAEGHPFYASIQWLAQSGVATGTRHPDGSATFEPTSPVSRQAMAAFLHRLPPLR